MIGCLNCGLTQLLDAHQNCLLILLEFYEAGDGFIASLRTSVVHTNRHEEALRPQRASLHKALQTILDLHYNLLPLFRDVFSTS